MSFSGSKPLSSMAFAAASTSPTEVRVIVTAEENLEFGGLAADAPGDVVGCPLADFNGVIHLQCPQHSAVRQLRADFTACANADGAGWDARRAADILTVQRVVRDLLTAAPLTVRVQLFYAVNIDAEQRQGSDEASDL